MSSWNKNDIEKGYSRSFSFEVIIGIIIIILIPVLLNYFVINNDYVSKASNDGWVSFFGGYFGGVLTLLGVFLTLKISQRESKRVEQLDEQRIFDERRLKVIPYLQYSFIEVERQDCAHFVELDEIKSNNISTRKKYMVILIENFGLEAACDISMNIYVGERLDCYSAEVVKILPANNKYEHVVCFEAPYYGGESSVFKYNWLGVIFYKDLLGNQYVQELCGCTDDVFNEGVLNVYFSEPHAARVIPGELYYKVPSKANCPIDPGEYISREFVGYSCEFNEAIDAAIDLNLMNLIDSAYEKTEKIFMDFKIYNVKDLRGDFYGAKTISDTIWDMILWKEQGLDSLRSITSFVVVRYNRRSNSLKIIDARIIDNTLIEGKENLLKFNKRFIKTLTSIT